MSTDHSADASAGVGVLASGGDRLIVPTALLMRLVDTAQALEAEVTYLRLKSTFERQAPGKASPATTDVPPIQTD